MKSITIRFIIVLIIIQALAVIAPLRALKMDAEKLDLTADIGTVSYSDKINQSSFEVDIKISNPNKNYVVVSNISYKLSFKDADGALLSEKVLEYPQSLTEETNEITLTFEGGALGPINGKVSSVEAEVAEFEVVGKTVADGKASGFAYATENPMFFLYAFSSICFCILSSMAFDIKSFIFSIIGIVITSSIAYTCAMQSTSYLVLAFLA